MKNNVSNSYKENQIKMSNSQELVIMLYEESLRLLNEILENFDISENKNFNKIKEEKKLEIEKPLKFNSNNENLQKNDLDKNKLLYKNLIKVQNIINELILGLDFKPDADFANRLQSIYIYIYKQLVSANIKKDIAIIKEVKNYMEKILEYWKLGLKNFSNTKIEKNNIKNKKLDFLT